jgi:hypothetical protein
LSIFGECSDTRFKLKSEAELNDWKLRKQTEAEEEEKKRAEQREEVNRQREQRKREREEEGNEEEGHEIQTPEGEKGQVRESESGGEFWESPVEVTIGHRAIGVFEERGEGGDTLGIGVEDGLEIGGEIEGAFDAATEGEKAPGLTAGGVFHFHSAEGGEMND